MLSKIVYKSYFLKKKTLQLFIIICVHQIIRPFKIILDL
jgi:hypothetical protein